MEMVAPCGICEKPDCLKPNNDTVKKAAKAACFTKYEDNNRVIKHTCRQGVAIPTRWQVVPVMVTGEVNLHTLIKL